MKILLTGANGYIGKRLLPVLLEKGHEVICCVRDRNRFDTSRYDTDRISVIEVNFLEKDTLGAIPEEIDAAYYLIHSMSVSISDFEELEAQAAIHFRDRLDQTKARQIIYLSGIVNEEKLSKHLHSRKQVEDILSGGKFGLTTLRAGIIVGSGSASFEIIRDLVEKLPIMITPQWLNTRSQPIAIRNVIQFLSGVLLREETFDRSFDIGGPEVLTYKEMLMTYARVRGLRRVIYTVPIMTTKISSYWLFFVTSTSYKLAVNLANSMKVEIVCKDNELQELLGVETITYEEAIRQAFDRVAQHDVLSSWTDAMSSNILDVGISKLIEVPVYGCYIDRRVRETKDEEAAIDKIWRIGGQNGWYFANGLWSFRGFIDKLFGGVGLRRGRRSETELLAGDSLDFWRVLCANREEKRVLLYAELKIQGEAWLEFKVRDSKVYQTATFRPLGIWGRLYWFFVFPVHNFVFHGMLKRIAS